MGGASFLPQGFEDLEPIAALWGLPTQNDRSLKRWSATSSEFREAYDAVFPRLADMLAYLDQQPLADMDAPAQKLLHLALAFAELAPHVELYKGAAQVPNSFENARFRPDHGDDVAGQTQ